jgi:hypothetical protein
MNAAPERRPDACMTWISNFGFSALAVGGCHALRGKVATAELQQYVGARLAKVARDPGAAHHRAILTTGDHRT